MFDMVIASDGSGKTLELVHQFLDLEQYRSIFILDDHSHRVWCMDHAVKLQSSPKMILIAPRSFSVWTKIKLMTERYQDSQDKLGYASTIVKFIQKDNFFFSMKEFLCFYLTEERQDEEKDLLRGLSAFSLSWEMGGNQTATWWNWNPRVRTLVL